MAVVVICDACGPRYTMCFFLFTVNRIPNIQIRTIDRKLGSKMVGDRRFKTQRKKIKVVQMKKQLMQQVKVILIKLLKNTSHQKI